MQTFNHKDITIKLCKRCGSKWSGDRITLEPGDKIEIITVKVTYCPACADEFSAEVDRPTYRRVGKRMK